MGEGDAVGIGRACGAGSGAELEMDVFQVWRVREGRVIEYWTFADRELAYRTAGLEPRDAA